MKNPTGSSNLPPASKRPRKLFVQYNRPSEVETSRLSLPVCQHEQEIMEAIHAHDVILITSATGSGKTTQLPQFLLEDGFGAPGSAHTNKIAVTQPRRVAALTCAKRVAYEIGQKAGDDVGYRVRHESRGGSKVDFVTDGVLLREVERDILLRDYSAVIIDEVHERSLNTDLLLSFLSRSVVLRKQRKLPALKVVIMSATLDVEGLFTGARALFPNPPLIKIPSRQHEVTVHFSKQTAEDYVEETIRKATKIHRRLPPGGILLFLTGRQEVEQVCTRLRSELSQPVSIPESDTKLGIKVQPFYALLADHLQRHVFLPTAQNVRKIVVATNIAETSVTVPDISYVVDCGRVKQKKYDKRTHFSSMNITWTSKASADQRAGRSGRTGPGHCYRLYSSAVYDQQMEEFGEAEIEQTPVENVVLRLRAMGIRYVHKFPFVAQMDRAEIAEAERLLTKLGALYDEDVMGGKRMLGVTDIGMKLAKLPVAPRLGRMLLEAKNVRRYAARIAGVLTVGNVLNRSGEKGKHEVFRNEKSEILTQLSAVCAAEHCAKGDRKELRGFCGRFGLHFKSVEEVLKIGAQLEEVLGIEDKSCLKPLTEREQEEICKAILCGFADCVARKLSREEGIAEGIEPRRAKRAYRTYEGGVGYLEGGNVMQGMVVYAEVVQVEVRKKGVDDFEAEEVEKKALLRGATRIDASWIPECAQGMCSFKWDASHAGAYDAQRDTVLHIAKVTYGSNWPVGSAKVATERLPEAQQESALVFARALLAGKVVPEVHIRADRAEVVLKETARQLNGIYSKRQLAHFVASKGVPMRSLGSVWISALQALAKQHTAMQDDSDGSSEIE